MGNIKVLDRLISDMIAAGEVVERPSSVVKELFENAKDAGATRIVIEIKDGGKSLIKVTDNGSGMDKDDAELSVIRYATSKLKDMDDLFNIKTLGFRGEALASICAVSKITLNTRREASLSGILLMAEGGEVISVTETGCPKGTEISVENLFYNTPARYKFLKKDTTEGAYIEEIVNRLILANPSISIKLIKDGREIRYSSGDSDYKSAIYAVYGASVTENLLKVDNERNDIKISGYVGNPNIAKPSRKFENFSVNGRVCKNRMFVTGLENAYFQKMAQGKYPFCMLNLEIDYSLCDVNVHPQKAEIKFSNENDIYDLIYLSVRDTLEQTLFVKEITHEQPVYEHKEEEYIQNNFVNRKPEETFPSFNRISELSFPKNTLRDARSVVFDFPADTMEEDIIVKEEAVVTEEIAENEPMYEPEFKITGQIFSSYIILEKDNEMLLLDQHAAHERINYEKIYEAYQKREITGQIMMSPKILEMPATDYSLAVDNKELFSEVGISLDDFNDNSVIIREIPSGIKEEQIERLIYEILEEIKLSGKVSDINLKFLFMIACKMSLKANTDITQTEMEALVKKAFLLNGKTTCPHGRPMFISFKKEYIENKFERS